MPAPRPVLESTFTTHDGVALFYRHWPASGPRQGAVLLFHRGHEHSARMGHLADELDLPDFDIFAWDARGHGRSPGPRGYAPGLDFTVRDMQTFADHIRSRHGIALQDMAVVAQSVGAVAAAAWVHDYAPPLRCQVLAAPAFKVKLYVPLARPGLRLWRALRGNFFVTSYVKARFLTQDAARQADYESDPLISRSISANILLELYEVAERIVADAATVTLPTQMLLSGRDWVVHPGPQHAYFETLGSLVKERHVFPDFFHDTLGERDRAPAVAAVRRFICERFAAPPAPVDLGQADRQGPTHDEATALAAPLPPYSPRGLYWAITRAGLRFGALLSRGLKLGRDTGFDSGCTLDYIYRNQATGWGPLGRFIDRTYLDAIGWRGIRERKRHLEELILRALARLAEEGRPARVLDIAAGHGRYVLDAVAAAPVRPAALLLRDFSPRNVTAGRTLLSERGYDDIGRFEEGDAFDRQALAALTPQVGVAIVSGLYELFPDNGPVRESLAGLAAAVEPGAYLIYTGQPWHPQLELIARALTSHREGRPWVMRRRSQAELDQLVAAAGFEKLEQRIDRWGIFTVSLARRRPGP
ncbi:MAG: bifunctional alpha/beta hydrolase/class I SAM-dependent methyltransferase [Dechloromonas sp.]|jgi:alpha-beta hydrolase superfamily lysophospholipase/SAM-dependent methyltransferase|nr:bifunctional alpha/beta hydrolase/class I SAM-dependent methyltransferase [Dechloromonas sp.]